MRISRRIFPCVLFVAIFTFCKTNHLTAQASSPSIIVSTSSISGLSYYLSEGPSIAQSFILDCKNLEGEVSVSPPDGFEISLDNSTFQNIPIDLPSTTTSATLYVRLRYNQPNNTYTGDLTISSINVTNQTIQLSGEIWVHDDWDYVEEFSQADLNGSYLNGSFTGNNGFIWNYTSCRNEGGSGTNFMKLTQGVKLNKEANGGKITAINLPNGIKDFQCSLYKGSSSTTNVEVTLLINDTIIASSETFNNDEIHLFTVKNINKTGNFTLEIKNNRSVTIVVDNIKWTSYTDPSATFIESSHKTADYMMAFTDDSGYEDAVISINGRNLTDNISITAPDRFLISSDNITFENSLEINRTSGTVFNKNIYIKLDPLSTTRKYTGNLVLSSSGAENVLVECIGATRPPIYTNLMINEVDADTRNITGTSSTDEYDFIELYSGSPGIANLDGYVLVTYNGSNASVDKNYSLDGYTTNQDGYFVMGNAAVLSAMTAYQVENAITPIPLSMVENNTILQNGPDAVALYYGVGGDFSQGDSLTTLNIMDAMVYTINDSRNQYPTNLMPLLNSGEPYINEDAYADETYDKQTNSMGRVTNGEGGLRNTTNYVPCIPTPGAENIALLGSGGLPTKSDIEDAICEIYGISNNIVVKSNENGIVFIYGLDGKLLMTKHKKNTTLEIPVQNNFYIVKFESNNGVTVNVISIH